MKFAFHIPLFAFRLNCSRFQLTILFNLKNPMSNVKKLFVKFQDKKNIYFAENRVLYHGAK